MERKASARWQGGLKDGKGSVSTASGLIEDAQYSFGTRFEQGKGTNPEELIAAAHASCFAMALSAQLEREGLHPESVDVNATVKLEKVGTDWTVTASHLDAAARIPGAETATFERAANAAKEGCPISRLLKTAITLTARLEGAAQRSAR
jgi:osmotically inducible protein OsmC